MTEREIAFTLKVQDDGSAVLAGAGQELDRLGRGAVDLNSTLADTGRTSGNLEGQVEALTSTMTRLDRVFEDTDADSLTRSFEDMITTVRTSTGTFEDFFDGIETGIDQSLKELNDWSQAGIDMVTRMTQAMTTAFDDFFFNVLKGRFDDLEDVFQAFLDSILRAFTAAMAQMASSQFMNWVFGGTGSGDSSGSGTGNGAGGLVNPLMTAGLLGFGNFLSFMAWLGLPLAGYALGSEAGGGGSGSAASAAIGALAGALFLGPLGGAVGGILGGVLGGLLGFERGADFIPETMPALIHRGERIFSADQNERITRAIESIGRSGPAVHITVQGSLVADESAFNRFVERIGDELHRQSFRRHG